MKRFCLKFINIVWLSGLVLLLGCSKTECGGTEYPDDSHGALKVLISLPDATRSTQEYDPLQFSTLRIYKLDRDTDDSVTETLIRKYRPVSEMPSDLFLVAGEYKITVEMGTGDEATFDRKSYYGETSFTLEANKEKTVSVKCNIINAIVKVVFDPSVAVAFDSGYSAYVSLSDEFSKSDAESGSVPTLKFTEDGTGYFLLQENTENMSWGFFGSSSDPDIDAKGASTGVIESPEPGMQYTLTYKYSKDADGFLSVSVQVREYESSYDDNFIFSPQPTLSGDGFDIGGIVPFYKEPVVFKVSSINPLGDVRFMMDGQTYEVLKAGEPSVGNSLNGISYEVTDQSNGLISINPEFFASLSGGIKELEFFMTDTDMVEGKADVRIAVPGALSVMTEDMWFGIPLNAVVTKPDHSSVVIKYREQGTDIWTEKTPVAGDDGVTYSLSDSGLELGVDYEIQLVVDGLEEGNKVTCGIPSGVQLPNAGFEEWHRQGNASYPYAENGTEFWGTGNPGATSIGDYNLTSESEDIRPGSTGKYSARLETKKPSIMGIGKLAAGNIFVGSFGAVDGMGGYVNMGREFEFNARPKALRVWYKYTPAGSDKGRIFVCLVNMTNGDRCHIVNTNSPDKTTFSPDDEFIYVDKTNPATLQGHVLAYGDLMLETVVGEWTMVEIPIDYREQYMSEKPNVLIVTASASYRGDYFEGEVGSLMFLDDIEFVY